MGLIGQAGAQLTSPPRIAHRFPYASPRIQDRLRSRSGPSGLRVLHVVNNLETGGAQTLIEALCIAQRSSGVESHVVVLLSRGTLSERIESAADSVTYLNLRNVFDACMVGVWRLRAVIKRLTPSVVHSHLMQADLLTLLAASRVPHMTTVHTSGGHESSFTARLVTRLLSRLSSRYDTVVACSPSAARFCSNTLGRKADDVLLNGSVLPGRESLELTSATSLLSVARWHPMKDHDNLFRALQQLGAAAPPLFCLGEGMTRELAGSRLETEYPGVIAIFEGPVTDVTKYLGEALCLIISSSHGEALPMAGIEALSHGVPVVTTDVGDCSLLAIAPSLLVPPGDPAALGAALRWVMASHADSPERLPTLARMHAEQNFDVTSTATAYRQLYAAMLPGSMAKS